MRDFSLEIGWGSVTLVLSVFFHSTWKNFIVSVSFLFFSIYLKERQLSIRIGSFPAVCPSGRVSRGTNKRGDSLLTWTRAFLGGPKIQFSMESGNWRYTRKGKEDGYLVWHFVIKKANRISYMIGKRNLWRASMTICNKKGKKDNHLVQNRSCRINATSKY